MRWRRAKQAGPEPKSLYGRWLLAVLLGRSELIERYGEPLGELTMAEGDSQCAISDRLFEQLVAMRFAVDQPVRDISDYVAAVVAAMDQSVRFGRLEAEALIRRALGEESVSLAGIDHDLATRIRAGLAAGVIREKGLAPEQVARMVVESEDQGRSADRAVIDRGVGHPGGPPLDRAGSPARPGR